MIYLNIVEVFLNWLLFTLFLLATAVYYVVHNYRPNFMIKSTFILLASLTFHQLFAAILWTLAITGASLIYSVQYLMIIPKIIIILALICYIRLSVQRKEDIKGLKNCFN